MLNNADFSVIQDTIKSIPYNWEMWRREEFLGDLAALKKEAIRDSEEVLAKEIWCYETAVRIHSLYIEAFSQMKKRAFYEGWCTLEQTEIQIINLSRHFNFDGNRLNVSFIDTHIRRFQELFPYKVFLSPEILEHEKICSICKEKVGIRNPCGHRVGEVYGGEMCYRIVTKADFLGISVVKNPVQKYSVAFPSDPQSGSSRDHYDYSLVRFVTEHLASPFHEWSCTWTKRRHPHERFKHIGRNDPCPCESGKKYKKCCLREKGVLRPHCEFDFSVPPPEECSMFEYSSQ